MTPYDVYRDFPKSYEYLVRWTPWFAWYRVELQNGRRVWLRWVEYEQISIGQYTGAIGSGPRTITHYRLAL